MINKRVLKLRSEYKSLTDKIKSLTQQRKSKLEELQSKCNHPLVAERDYKESTFFGTDPPRRICGVCGYEEQGWCCGYKKLDKENVRDVDDYTFNLLRYTINKIIEVLIR